jgi:hypothetical protein
VKRYSFFANVANFLCLSSFSKEDIDADYDELEFGNDDDEVDLAFKKMSTFLE